MGGLSLMLCFLLLSLDVVAPPRPRRHACACPALSPRHPRLVMHPRLPPPPSLLVSTFSVLFVPHGGSEAPQSRPIAPRPRQAGRNTERVRA